MNETNSREIHYSHIPLVREKAVLNTSQHSLFLPYIPEMFFILFLRASNVLLQLK